MKKKLTDSSRYRLLKLFRIMRFVAFLLLVGLMHSYAESSYGQTSGKLNFKVEDFTLEEILEKIERETDYHFFYQTEDLTREKTFTIDIKGGSVFRILDQVLPQANLSYEVFDKYIAINSQGDKASVVKQKEQPVSGTVRDASGNPIPGVTVFIKGTSQGIITDIEGGYSLNNVPSDALLVFSFVGMKTQEVAVNGTAVIDIIMKEENIGIGEVVAVGYGVQKKVNLSGAVASVNMSQVIESRPTTNISSALSGIAAGVSVTSSNNRPGDDNATILVRGQGTLNSSSPLVVIDGVEAPINSVNPQDIESVSVLKDAASAAIYGSRAANGVILITTKQGQKGSLKVDYNGYVSFESIRKTLTPVSNYADYMEYMNEGYVNSNLATLYSEDMINAWRTGNDPLLYPNTDWIDATFNNSVATNHVLSMSGGSDKIRFYSSFGYLDNPGVMDNSGQRKYSSRFNIEGEVRPWLKLGANLNGYFSDLDVGTDNIENVFTYASATTPGMVFRAPDGRYGAMNNPEDDPQSAGNNPLYRLNSISGNYARHNIRSRFFGTLIPVEGLSITGSFNYDFTDEQLEKKPVFIASWNFLSNVITRTGEGRTYITNKDNKMIRHFCDVVIRYDHQFLDDQLDFKAMAGASQEQYLSKNFSTTKYDLVDLNLDALDAATGDATAGGSATEWAMHSYFGRMNLGWADKYLLELNIRADASSRFLEGNRWGYFPSASVAWRIDQEDFMKDITSRWLSSLKIRGSYGSLGNNSVGNYDAQSVFAQANYSWGNAMVVGLAQKDLANANLSWETTYVTNLGIDFGAINNRLTGTLDIFKKKTQDILIDLPAPAVHGTSSIPKQNSATVTNKGFELTLGWQKKKGDFNYSLNGNFTYVTNKVNKFKGEDYSLSGVNYIREGYAINSQYMLRVDRIIQTDEDMAIVNDMLTKNPDAFAAYGVPEKGDLLYQDINKDGAIDSNDRDIVSDGNNPKYLFGFNTSLGYKGFDLSILFQGVAGVEAYWQGAQYNTPTVRYGYQLNKEVVDGRWYEGRTDASYPRLLQYSDTRNTKASDFYLENKSYLKIRNVQVGYTLPKSVCDRLFVSRLRIYGSLENYFTFTSYKGFDPEVSGMKYPSMKQAVIGVNLSF